MTDCRKIWDGGRRGRENEESMQKWKTSDGLELYIESRRKDQRPWIDLDRTMRKEREAKIETRGRRRRRGVWKKLLCHGAIK